MSEQEKMNSSEDAETKTKILDEDSMSNETSMENKCSVCGLIYSSQESLNYHYRINHNLENLMKQTQSQENTSRLLSEYKNVENENMKNNTEESEKELDSMNSEKNLPENKITSEYGTEENKMPKTDTGEALIGLSQMKNQYKCEIDGESFSNQNNLDQHMKNIHGKDYSERQETEKSQHV